MLELFIQQQEAEIFSAIEKNAIIHRCPTAQLCKVGVRLMPFLKPVEIHVKSTTLQRATYQLNDNVRSMPAIQSISFLARDSIYSALYAVARPSVCPSHGWVSQRWFKIGSCNLHHSVAP